MLAVQVTVRTEQLGLTYMSPLPGKHGPCIGNMRVLCSLTSRGPIPVEQEQDKIVMGNVSLEYIL